MQTRLNTHANIALGTLMLASACNPGAPENPTWASDVAPILAANCVRCHTVPAIGGAPNGFRLDTYEDWIADDGRVIRGAGTMAPYMVLRIKHETDPMPPRFGLDDVQIETIESWARDLGADGRPVHGGPRPANQAPGMTILGMEEVEDALVIEYEIRDPDHDIVVGELRAGDVVLTRELHSGRGQVRWDIGAFASGNYQLSARLRDGSAEHAVDLVPYDVNHPDNTAPTVRIIRPVRDEIVASNEGQIFVIRVNIDDPDVAGMTMSIRAQLGNQSVEVLPAQAALPGENTVNWDIADVPEGLDWHLVVTVSDGTTTRTVESGPFIVSHRTTTDTFATIHEAILAGRCSYCHQGSTIPGMTYNFNSPGQVQAGDPPGVYDVRGLIYRRAVQQRTMPPISLGVPLSAEEAERLGNWLLAGAPQQ